MPAITESDIEDYVIELSKNLGYAYRYGPDIAPGGKDQERKTYDQIVLT